MIIYGTRGITYQKADGIFHCPQCRSDSKFSHKRVRRFFTLYFIPLIPLDLHGEYIECGQCGGTYDLTVLNWDPAEDDAFDASFQTAVKRVMVGVMLADGDVDDGEIDTLCEIYGELTGTAMTPEQARLEVSNAAMNQQDLFESLSELSGNLNPHGKSMVIKAAFHVAAADGDFADAEKELIAQVGQALDMTSDDIALAIQEVVQSDTGE